MVLSHPRYAIAPPATAKKPRRPIPLWLRPDYRFDRSLVLEPSGVVQGPVQPSAQMAQARFALLGRPELCTNCGDRAARPPLPPLSADPALPDEGSVTLGVELPLAGLARAFEARAPDSVSKACA